MCFRPPTAGKPTKCPQCGAINPATAKTCIKCKADLTKPKDNNDQGKLEDSYGWTGRQGFGGPLKKSIPLSYKYCG